MQGVNVTTHDPEVEIDWLELGHGFANTSDVNQAAFLLGLSRVFSNMSWGSTQIAGLGYEVREGSSSNVVLEVLREIVGSIAGEES